MKNTSEQFEDLKKSIKLDLNLAQLNGDIERAKILNHIHHTITEAQREYAHSLNTFGEIVMDF